MNKNKEDQEAYFLGIDWGASRVGLAIADSETKIASVLEDVSERDSLRAVKKKMREFNINTVILGYPENKVFGSNKEALRVFEKRLKSMGLEVQKENEAFSSRLAQSNLAMRGEKGFSKEDNAESARIVLQSWLDKR